MAVNTTRNGTDLLRAAYCRAGGIVAIAMGASVAALAIAALAGWLAEAGAQTGTFAAGVLLAAGAVLAILGALLLAGRVWAQPALLGFLGLWLVAVVAVIARDLVSGPGGRPPWAYAAILAALGLAALAVAILWNASAPNSRLRFGSNVIVAAALAIAVLIVFNLIAQGQGNYWRRDVQWLGQYGLSDRSKKILRGVREPVRLTSLYSASEANAAAPERSGRVWELLTEIHDLNPRIEIGRAVSDSERAEILARIARQSRDRAPAYAKLLKEFLAEGPPMLESLRAQQAQWRQLAGGSYLDLWGVAAQVTDMLKGLHQEEEDLVLRLPKELSGLPDYAKLVQEIKGVCSRGKDGLAAIDQNLKRVSKIPEAVAANQSAVAAKVDELTAAIKDLLQALSAASTSPATQTADPSEVLKRFAAACEKASEMAAAAAKALDEVAGSENAGLVRGSAAWLLPGDERPVVVGGMVMMARPNLTREFLSLSEGLLQQKATVEGILQRQTKESQTKTVEALREGLADLREGVAELTFNAKKAVSRLATVDDATAVLFKQAAEGKYLQNPIAEYSKVMEEANRLPAHPVSTLAGDLAEENVILVETADKTEAVRFDQVWPLRARPQGAAMMEAAEQRVFNGDAALCAKVQALTQRPCATVVLAYMEVPPQLAQMGGGEMGMTPRDLDELQRRLQQANCRVKTWDLSMHEAPVEVADPNEAKMPMVLIVLPPPPMPPMMMRPDDPSAFGPRHIERIKRLLDSNEADGAIFLAQFQFPMGMGAPPAPYGWNEYLSPDWGIQAKTDYLLIPAEPDETGQRLRLSVSQLRYLPLSTFSDHPVGKPLQGQRVFWQFPCPVTATGKRSSGVTVRSLLTVPARGTTLWATNDIQRIQQQIEEGGSYISPDYARGDMKVPFDVAVAAARQGEPNQSNARVVVLGLGASFADSYISSPIVTLKEKNVIAAEDPPRADLDVVVNSVYWVCGLENYIAAGPVQVQSIRNIPESTYRVLWTLCVIGLPVVLLGAGGLVLLIRRR